MSKELLAYIELSYEYAHGRSDEVPPPIGHGIGLAFALWGMQQLGSFFLTHYYGRSLVAG